MILQNSNRKAAKEYEEVYHLQLYHFLFVSAGLICRKNTKPYQKGCKKEKIENSKGYREKVLSWNGY